MSPDETSPGVDLPQISERQEIILGLIVREYVQHGQPVGSKTLVEQYDLGVSSATVRNEMVLLEQHGLIYAPHTSAGRVPTQHGYRFFVRHLVTDSSLTARERRRIAQQFQTASPTIGELPRLAAMTLARTAQAAALVTPPRAVENRFKHLELISTQGRMVLMVLVLQGGTVQQQVLTLAESVTQEVLSHTAKLVNLACAGLGAEAVRGKARGFSDELSREIGELVAEAMVRADQPAAGEVFGYGLSESLPSFGDDAAQQAIRVWEEQTLLDSILGDVMASDAPDVRVVVAGEGRWEDLSHLSMVLGRYGTPRARGAVGVLGPTRMRYGRAVSAVRYVVGLMSDLLDDVYRDPAGE